jgi:hypothetical protein
MQSQNEGLQKIGKSLELMMEDDKPKPAPAAAGERKPRAVPSTVTNRVYVGNLPWQTSWQDLKDHFRTVGAPVHASVFLDEHGRSKGCGCGRFDFLSAALARVSSISLFLLCAVSWSLLARRRLCALSLSSTTLPLARPVA